MSTGRDVTRDTRDTAVRRPWWRQRRWPAVLALVLVLVAAVGYQRLSAGPTSTTVGACRVVNHPSPTSRSSCIGVDLAGRDLHGVDLRLADLRKADLRGADLSESILYGADLTGADLRDADLSRADLTGTNLNMAELGSTDFSDAIVSGMGVTNTVLGADGTSVWQDGDEPVLFTATSGTQPGIVTNTCAHREGLYYPGVTTLSCSLSTGAGPGQSMSYGVLVEVKEPPRVDAPARIDARVGQALSVHIEAESAYPAVQTTFRGKLPAGLSWDPATQRLVGTPTASAAGEHDLTFVAANGRTVERRITLVVAG